MVLLPGNKLLNIGAICRCEFVPLTPAIGETPAAPPTLTMAMADGESLIIEGPIAVGLWGLIMRIVPVSINEKGELGTKQQGPAGKILVPQGALPPIG
jgi:hypothetical protein